MGIVDVIFGFNALVLVASAIGVISSRNTVYAALFLVLSFVTSSILWLLIEAEFLAIVLVLVYVGAVMVLFLFVVMMLDVEVAAVREGFTRYAPFGVIMAGIVVFELLTLFWARASGLPIAAELVRRAPDASNTREIGVALYTNHVFEFELAAFILLLAIVAAIMLTLRSRPGLKAQDVAAQVKVRREDRVRIVKVPAERGE
ncbi:MAG: NADH-quinone oxidoreductase subunit J [Gammaproteobacteria bacterium]|nr:NADH-quinone oxidoreductase subunit J [Gammaproteobacteria bacterium]